MVVGDFAKHLECVVVGSGPGGYVAAIRAAQLGQKVTIIERDEIGGTCLNVGCIPSKAMIHVSENYHRSLQGNPYGLKLGKPELDMKQTQEWKNTQVVKQLTQGIQALLRKNKVEIVKGEAHFVDNTKIRVVTEDAGQTYTFDSCILATGSRPIQIKGFKFGGRILDSTGVLNLDHIPESLAIVGGGYIGCELANVFANLGTKVTILEGSKQILPNFSKDLVKFVEQDYESKGVTIKTNVLAKEAKNNEKSVTVSYESDGKIESMDVDYVLVTVGRRPNTDDIGLEYTDVKVSDRGLVEIDDQGRTSVETIFAIGDIVPGAALAHKASYEAKVVAEVINGHAAGFDYSVIPAVCFTSPEIAVVGHNLQQAKEAGYDAKAYQFPYAANGRALSMNETLGFVRIITEKESNAVIGAEIVGEHASELIGELTMAIESNLTVEDISLIIHTHPTLGEMIMDVSELALGLPIHI